MRGQHPRDTYMADRQYEEAMKCEPTKLGKLFIEQNARYASKEITLEQLIANMNHIARKHGITEDSG